MTTLIGTLILVCVLVGGIYLYVGAGRLEREIRAQSSERRARPVFAGDPDGRRDGGVGAARAGQQSTSNGHGRRPRRRPVDEDEGGET